MNAATEQTNKYIQILIPTRSPFCFKLELFLKMNSIPYNVSTSDPFGPKGKAPWIEWNGEAIGDSSLIVERLADKNAVDKKYTEAQLLEGHAYKTMLEEHAYW